MKTYLITEREVLIRVYEVQANDKDHAMQEFESMRQFGADNCNLVEDTIEECEVVDIKEVTVQS